MLPDYFLSSLAGAFRCSSLGMYFGWQKDKIPDCPWYRFNCNTYRKAALYDLSWSLFNFHLQKPSVQPICVWLSLGMAGPVAEENQGGEWKSQMPEACLPEGNPHTGRGYAWLHLWRYTAIQFLNILVMPYSWACWRTHSSAFILMCTHISVRSFIHALPIYDACTQVLRGQKPNHTAALNDPRLCELSSQLLWVMPYTLFLALHASSHRAMWVCSEQSVLLVTPRGRGSLHTPWAVPSH